MSQIPSYSPASDLTGTELFVADQTGSTVKVTANQIKTFARGAIGPQGPQGPAGPQGPTGATGSVGAQGATGAPGLSWVNGGWVTSTAYSTNQALSHGGKSYRCIAGHTSSSSDEPGVGTNEATYWEMLSDTGAQGPQGPDGAQGVQGDPGPQGATGAQGPAVIADDSVTNVKLANVAEYTIKGRASAGTGDPQDLTATQVRTLLNVESGATADQTAGEIEAIVSHDNLQGVAANEHLDWTSGAQGGFHSLGIDDNSTAGPVLNLADTIATLTPTSTTVTFDITRGVTTAALGLGGGSTGSNGGNIILWGGSHATNPSEVWFRTGATTAFKVNASGNVTATGVISGSNLSGNNTGDQTITLTGDVTGTGTGSFAATLSSTVITGKTNIGAGTIVDADELLIYDASATALKAADMNSVKAYIASYLTHDGFSDYNPDEHIDWTSASGEIIDVSNIPEFGPGTAGLVPSAAGAGPQTDFLRADGTWNPATITALDLDSEIASGDHMETGITSIMTAGQNLVFGDLCRVNNSGKMVKANASTITTGVSMAIALETLSTDDPGSFLLLGFIKDQSWSWTTPGAQLYLSLGSGAMTETPPSGLGQVIQVVGIVMSSDRIYFRPSLDVHIYGA